ncbi:MAG: hypothetical protein GQ541_06020 [Desulfovibrionaceae bacterium]|nr:hypothetical protein [Desulfovibrionaceae bacterium]
MSDLFAIKDADHFQQLHREWVDHELKNEASSRQAFWSEAVAVGCENFIKEIQQKLAGRIPGRSIVSQKGTTMLKESQPAYRTLFEPEKNVLSLQNSYLYESNP